MPAFQGRLERRLDMLRAMLPALAGGRVEVRKLDTGTTLAGVAFGAAAESPPAAALRRHFTAPSGLCFGAPPTDDLRLLAEHRLVVPDDVCTGQVKTNPWLVEPDRSWLTPPDR